jgi:predicted ATPase/DNA-binding SARP family transcriptional activator
MQIAMLGPLEVRADDGEALAVSGARLRRLLMALALHPRRVVTAGYLVDAVWGDEPPAMAGNAVQALVSRLRRALPGIEVANRANGYLLDVDPDAVDVRRFERLVTAGRAAAPTAPQEAVATLRAALDLWRGPALADAAGAEFARATVARLNELRLVALQERIDAELRRGAPGTSGPLVAELEGLVAAHPLREPLVKLLIRALHASGDRGRALAVYEQARTRLAEELGVAPGADLAAEHLRILRADAAPADGAPGPDGGAGRPVAARPAAAGKPAGPPGGATAPGPRPTNLRAEISSFVGRERDLAGVDALLASARLATLIGPGGAGKTRLAAAAARGRLETMPDGAWMVELAPIADPADVVPAALAALGVRDRALVRTAGGTDSVVDPVERLLSALSHREALLVLDNCEHLVAAAAHLADTVLGACPGIRILATSREPLGVTGEALWPVGPLALPAGGVAAPEDLARYPAVRLLVQRAALVRPGFSVTADNAGALLRICQALDGMPLAIELAAARLRVMTPEQLAARLGDRFAVLTGGSRTALPRHQTLRAVVDWSWDLLDEAERALLRRLSVFTGGATLPAVEAVCAGAGLAAERVLDALAGLVDKSLVTVRDDPPEPRYHLLETIRAYGQMRLDEAGERERLRAAHAAYFLGFATDGRHELLGAEQLDALARLAADHDNFIAALRGAVGAGDAGTAVVLTASLAWYWWLRGHRVEGAELCASALALAETREPDGRPQPEELAMAYTIGAILTIDGVRDSGRALAWLEAAVALVHDIPAPASPLLRMVEPMYELFRSYGTGEAAASPGISMPVDDPDPWIAGMARVMRGHVALNFGRSHAEAERDFQRALAAFRSLGERWGMAFTLGSLAALVGWRGEFGPAIAFGEEAVRCVVELGAAEDEVEVRVRQVQLLWADGQRDRARAELALADRTAQRLGVAHVRSLVAIVGADLARFQGDLVLAADRARRAEELMPEHGVAPQFRSIVASSRGYLEAARGDLDEARRHHRRAVELAVSSFDAPVVGQALVGLAEVVLDDGDAGLAATVLGAGTGIRGCPDLSLVDGVRVAARAEAALGSAAFRRAYQRGLSATAVQIGELVGVQIPEVPALTSSA